MTQRNYLLALLLLIAAALAAQLGLLDAGLYRLTSDESARVITAWHLSWSNALEPFLWPPFYKLFVGTALKLYPAIFMTPRVLVSAAGLLSLLALARLATALFQDRRISLISVILAVLLPQRLLFSVVPLSDIYYFLFVISAAALIAEWIHTQRAQSLLLACVCVLLAETVRFEAGLFAIFVEILLLHRGLIRRDLASASLAAATFLLFIFPALWALNSYVWYGSLSNINVAAQQFIGEFGRNYPDAIKWSPLRFFIQDMIWNPLAVPGLGAVAWLSLRDRAIRTWGLLFGLPLLVFSLYAVVTFSIPTAATWRTSGVWTLMMLPFDAFIVLRAGMFLTRSIRLARPAIALLLLLAILPMGVRSFWYAREGMRNNDTLHAHQERALDRFLNRQLLVSPGMQVLVDSSTNLDYLDVLAFSRFPDRLVLTAIGDPVRIGFYEPMRRAYDGDPAVAGLLTDHFGLDHGGSPAALEAYHVRFLVIRNPAFLVALDASPLVIRLRQFNDWTLYAVKPLSLQDQVGIPFKPSHLDPRAG